MVIDVKCVIMLFTTADQKRQICVMRCSASVCLAIVYSTIKLQLAILIGV